MWARNFVNLFASPLTINEYVLGLVTTSIMTTSIAIGTMGLFAWLFFAYNLFLFGFALIPFLLVLFVFGLALGIIGLVIILRFGPSSESIIWTLPASLAPLSGVFYPISTLPHALQWIAHILPSSYVFEGMRAIVLAGQFNNFNLFIGFILSLLYLVLAQRLLARYYRLTLQKGLFTRFLTDEF